MSEFPRYYQRGQALLRNYAIFCDLVEKPISNLSDKQALLNTIKKIFVFFWKILRDFLKHRGIIEYYPRKIIQKSVDEKIIDESFLIWIDYIDILNDLIYENESNNSVLIDKIINVYSKEIYKIDNFVENELRKNCVQDNILYQNFHKISYSFDKPKYIAEEIGINEYLYSLLLNYFKDNSEIKYVWLHGSRAKGNYLPNSDIDLLVDCPLETLEDIQRNVNLLRIPHRIDIACIYDTGNVEFLVNTSEHAKILFRREDF